MNGVLIINKSAGITSHDAVLIVKKLFKLKKVGHTGTLDPMATGILVLCLGEATKLTPFLQNQNKEYLAQLTLGITTDTLDKWGKILTQKPVSITTEKISTVFDEFRGKIKQTPPLVSAIKINGTPLYKLARKGIATTITIPEREVTIHELELINIENGEYPRVDFRVLSSSGTYIRSLCADIGKRLDCGGHLSKLTRTKVGEFDLKQAMDLDKIKEMNLNELKKHIFSLNRILPYLSIKIGNEAAKVIRQGQALIENMIIEIAPHTTLVENKLLKIVDEKENLVAIAKKTKHFFAQPIRVFNE